MMKSIRPALTLLLALGGGLRLSAVEVRYFEKDGITYRESRQVIRRPINDTRVESRQCTVYRTKCSTELQSVQRTVQTPVTEYRWTPVYERSWNPLAPPTLAYRYMPTTRWETRTQTVNVPVTRRELVPETRTQQYPVTTQKVAEEEIVTRVAVGTRPPTALAVSQPAAAQPTFTQPTFTQPSFTQPSTMKPATNPTSSGSSSDPFASSPASGGGSLTRPSGEPVFGRGGAGSNSAASAPDNSAVGRRFGGVSNLQTDPPRQGTTWRSDTDVQR